MNLFDWLLISTPDGATYLQAIIMIILVILTFKAFVIPMIKWTKEVWISLDEE